MDKVVAVSVDGVLAVEHGGGLSVRLVGLVSRGLGQVPVLSQLHGFWLISVRVGAVALGHSDVDEWVAHSV